MPNTDLVQFVRDSLAAGASREDTRRALMPAGWSESQISSALDVFSDTDFVLPVPRPKPQMSSRDAFLYVVMFGTLYISAFNLGSMIFDFLNLLLPAATGTAVVALRASIRFSVAALIIAFPIFLYMSHLVLKMVKADPIHRNSAIRKWLTYITLAIAAFTVIGDLISLLYGLLSGELTLRFILKSLTIFILATSIFWYYFGTMQSDDATISR